MDTRHKTEIPTTVCAHLSADTFTKVMRFPVIKDRTCLHGKWDFCTLKFRFFFLNGNWTSNLQFSKVHQASQM